MDTMNSFWPLPSGKIWTLKVPEIVPLVVNCAIKTRFDSPAMPLGLPFRMYQTPPDGLANDIPEAALVEMKLSTHGSLGLATVEMVVWFPVGT